MVSQPGCILQTRINLEYRLTASQEFVTGGYGWDRHYNSAAFDKGITWKAAYCLKILFFNESRPVGYQQLLQI